ncbi:helix-turn-helix domain-containing protein [Auritidibacter ignavus]|uniref:Antitoxin HicB n=1 Tax=Auritidibacter ignavus TaxID=678932 RepID=A0AAJ6AMJ5_9MICC|nr:helix-turn-helix domain-containing protein [Auritidibacter ignavus]WGH83126.1 antitoxin HicB [Auritidibacter ignavus]WGH92756.1 antitoxin HicB [Auritidibacter ignavus]
MSAYTAIARRWSGGWEIHVTDLGVTQARTLAAAEQQAADYIETLTGEAPVAVTDTPDLGELGSKVVQARKLSQDAAEAQARAASEIRGAVAELRSQGLSVTDIAAILGVSRGRVSQLTTGPHEEKAAA